MQVASPVTLRPERNSHLTMSSRKPFNLTLIIGILCIVGTAIALAAVIIASQPAKTTFLVPSGQIPAYREIAANQLTEVRVNEDQALDGFLTVAEANDLAKDGARLYSLAPLAKGMLVPNSAVSNDANNSLQVVSPDETLVGATTTLPGSLIGSIVPGRVVDVIVGGNSGGSAEFAKVIAIGGANAAAGLTGVETPVTGTEQATKSDDIQVIFAVAKSDAPLIAGQDVSMTLHPFCEITPEGTIVPTAEDQSAACVVPAGRDAGKATK